MKFFIFCAVWIKSRLVSLLTVHQPPVEPYHPRHSHRSSIPIGESQHFISSYLGLKKTGKWLQLLDSSFMSTHQTLECLCYVVFFQCLEHMMAMSLAIVRSWAEKTVVICYYTCHVAMCALLVLLVGWCVFMVDGLMPANKCPVCHSADREAVYARTHCGQRYRSPESRHRGGAQRKTWVSIKLYVKEKGESILWTAVCKTVIDKQSLQTWSDSLLWLYFCIPTKNICQIEMC